MPVNSTRRDYDKNSEKWCLVRKVVHSDVKSLIKDVDINDPTRNKRYKEDAILTNFTSRTKAGLVGAVFRREAVIELPDSISYLLEDATGLHMPLAKLAQEITGEVLVTGRYGLLVDYPPAQEDKTIAELEALDLKARIYKYKPESIINWQMQQINGKFVITLVVLKECVELLGEDGFEWVEEDQYRVLRLINGVYTQQLFNKDLDPITDVMIPKDANGNLWSEIPFVFVGSEDNDADIDPIPLYDLALLNIGHLNNSADFEEFLHIIGQPTLIFSSSLSQEQLKAANPNGIKMGARVAHNIGEGGTAEFLQVQPNQILNEAMARKEEQAVMLGARLIVPQADRETAVAAQMRHSGETSILATIANNVESALIECCEYVRKFMDGTEEDSGIKIKLNDQFFDKTIDPNLIMAQIQLMDKGILAKYDVRQVLKSYGIIDEVRSDAELDSDATPVNNPINPTNGT